MVLPCTPAMVLNAICIAEYPCRYIPQPATMEFSLCGVAVTLVRVGISAEFTFTVIFLVMEPIPSVVHTTVAVPLVVLGRAVAQSRGIVIATEFATPVLVMVFDPRVTFMVCVKAAYLLVYTVKLPPVVTLLAESVAGDVLGIVDKVGDADAVTVPLLEAVFT